MQAAFGDYLISDDKMKLDLDTVQGFLQRSYWAPERPKHVIAKSVENSLCYGVYDRDGRQVAFARAVTDYATMYYLCDVFVDEAHRGSGIGKALVGAVFQSEQLQGLSGLLRTADAHELYEKFGFSKVEDRFMRRPPEEGAAR